MAIVAGLAGMAAVPAQAGGASMTVSATVVPTCQLDAGNLAFGVVGSYDPRSEGQALLTMDCTPGTAYSVTMDEGRNGRRRMADAAGAAFLSYEIYQDAAGSVRWGSDASAALGGIAPPDGHVVMSAYGRIAADLAVAGSYSDIVTVLVSF